MPLPRVLSVGFIAMVVVVVILWAMNLNLTGWVGAWCTSEQSKVYVAGVPIVLLTGLGAAWVYSVGPGSRLPGPGMLRGLIFGLVVAAVCIWPLPTIVAGVAHTAEDARHIADGSIQKGAKIERSEIPPFPNIGITPPLAAFTAEKPWINKADWEGRLAPFLIAFGIYGLILGLCLDDPERRKKKH